MAAAGVRAGRFLDGGFQGRGMLVARLSGRVAVAIQPGSVSPGVSWAAVGL